MPLNELLDHQSESRIEKKQGFFPKFKRQKTLMKLSVQEKKV